MIGVLTRSVDKGVVKENVIMIDPETLKSGPGPLLKGNQGISPFTETFRAKILRYTRSDIYGIALFQYPWGAPCFWLTAGSWTIPTGPSELGVADTAVFPGPSPCSGEGNVDYARVYYTWNSRTNKTSQPGMGAVATFPGEWQAPGWGYDLFYNFEVSVDVVRPKGETNTLESWYQGHGRWRVTLVPPDEDPGFDFSGETVRETYVADNDSCIGSGASKPNALPVNGPKPGNFGDSLGYDVCVIEYVRATKRTPCGYGIVQKMEISSPADGGAFTEYSLNKLYFRVTGQLIDQVEGQHAIGNIITQRITPLSTPRPAYIAWPTSRLDCLASQDRWKYITKF